MWAVGPVSMADYFLQSQADSQRSMVCSPPQKYFVSKYSTLKIEIGIRILNVVMYMKEADSIHKMHRPKPRLAVLVNSLQISTLPIYSILSWKQIPPYSWKGMAMRTDALMLVSLCMMAPAALSYDFFVINRAWRSQVFHDFLSLLFCVMLDHWGVCCSLLPPATETLSRRLC